MEVELWKIDQIKSNVHLIKERCWSFFNRPAIIRVAHTYWVSNFLSNHQIIEWTKNRDDGMTLSLRSEATYWSLVHCLICLNSPMMSFFRKSISAIIDSFGNEIKEPNKLQKGKHGVFSNLGKCLCQKHAHVWVCKWWSSSWWQQMTWVGLFRSDLRAASRVSSSSTKSLHLRQNMFWDLL